MPSIALNSSNTKTKFYKTNLNFTILITVWKKRGTYIRTTRADKKGAAGAVKDRFIVF